MTRHDWISTVARVFCGLVFIMHGYPKIMNLAGTSMFFSENFGVPGWLAIPIAILEFFGGILLVAGFATRIVSALFIFEMIGAMLFVHLPHGWDVFRGGFEFNLALVILLLTVVLLGPGPLSVDAAILRRRGAGYAPEEPTAV
jgi:putative oxidoreductase